MIQNPEYLRELDKLLIQCRKNGYSLLEITAYIVRKYGLRIKDVEFYRDLYPIEFHAFQYPKENKKKYT